MNNLEIITADTAARIEVIGEELAASYKSAFAGPPWNEVSRCNTDECGTGLTSLDIACACPNCGSDLVEAYETTQLVEGWSTMLKEENAFFEVSFEGNQPQRATIARPTNVDELIARKYADVPAMKDWLSRRFSGDFVWVEDTFANRDRKATGNLKDRGATLGRIASFYGGAPILTRTLSPAIVAATLRDAKPNTKIYIGSEGVGSSIVNQVFDNPGYSLPSAPDRRTLLANNASLTSMR